MDWYDYDTGEKPKVKVEGFEGYSMKVKREEVYVKKKVEFKGLDNLLDSINTDESEAEKILSDEQYYQNYVKQLLKQRNKQIALENKLVDENYEPKDVENQDSEDNFFFSKTSTVSDIDIIKGIYAPVVVIDDEIQKLENADKTDKNSVSDDSKKENPQI